MSTLAAGDYSQTPIPLPPAPRRVVSSSSWNREIEIPKTLATRRNPPPASPRRFATPGLLCKAPEAGVA